MRISDLTLRLSTLLLATQVIAQGAHAPTQTGAVRVDAKLVIRAQDLGVGRMLADLSFTDSTGQTGKLSDYGEGKALVIAVRDVGCPVSKKYGPGLARLAKRYQDRGVSFLYLNLSEQDEISDIESEIKRYDLMGRYVHDPKGEIGKILGARSTTEVFLLDAARTLRYRGAIDDQYGIGFTRDEPQHTFLVDALDALLDSKEIEVAATQAPGCMLDMGGPVTAIAEATYHNRISRILQDNCMTCHRDDGVGPFALSSFTKARGRRGMIRFALEAGMMPPWFADERSGPFVNDRSLNSDDKTALLDWIENDCPKGDAEDAPLPRTFADDWQLGEPDLLLETDPVEVPAEGTIEYQYRYVTNPLKEDRWVRSIEINSSQPQVVHHVLVFIEEPRKEGESRRDFINRFDGGLFGYFGSMIPGQETTVYPEGMGKLLPAGASLKLQIHYTANGEAALDQTTIGFNFMDEEPAHEMVTSSAYNLRFLIRPGDPSTKVVGRFRFKEDGVIYSLAPHMHVRGSAFTYLLKFPDGRRQEVLSVPGYDFNWQIRYRLHDPIKVPKGTTLEATGWFDNSEDNPANPDPTATVRFGEQTWEEMMIGYFEWYRQAR